MKKITILALFTSLLLVSCKDFLVEEPNLSQTTELTLSTYSGLNNSVAGAYSPLADYDLYGCEYILNSEIRSGNAKRPTNTNFGSGRLVTPYYMAYTAENTEYVWEDAYYIISAVNNVLEALPAIETSNEISQQDLDNLEAEALFLRALMHFDLVRTYAHAYTKGSSGMGVPVILVTDATGSEQPARNTLEETFGQIVTDLLSAESLIEPSYYRSSFVDPKASVTIYAIQALLSRVYLYMGEYQKCANYATTVINSGAYTPWTQEELGSSDTWGADVPIGGEVIFEIYATSSNSYDGYWNCISFYTDPAGYGDCAASTQLTDLYEDGDIRGTLFRTDEYEVSGGELWTTKYIGKGNSTPNTNNTIVLRLTEMYLNRAEALANGASISGASALTDLNLIAERAGATTYAAAGLTNILLERRKEFAFEGHYWFDLARTKSSLSYSDVAVTRELASDAGLWAMYIPSREIEVNLNLIQNVY